MGVLQRQFFVREAQEVATELKRHLQDEAEMLYALADRLNATGDEEFIDYAREVQYQAERLERLVEDL